MSSPITIDFSLQKDGAVMPSMLIARNEQNKISVSDVKQQLQAELGLKVSALYLQVEDGEIFVGFDAKGFSTHPFPDLPSGRHMLRIREAASGVSVPVDIALYENPEILLRTQMVSVDDQNRISLAELKKSAESALGVKNGMLYVYDVVRAAGGASTSAAAGPHIYLCDGDGSDRVSLTALPQPLPGAHRRFLVAKSESDLNFSVSLDKLFLHESLMKKAYHKIPGLKEHYFLGLVAMHQPDGKPIQQVVKDVSPAICGNPENDLKGSCLAMHLKLERNTTGAIIVSAQMWEEDSSASAVLHAKSLYDPDEVTKLFNPCLRDSEKTLSEALSQVSTGVSSVGKVVGGVPIPQAVAAGTALQGSSEFFSMGSKFYEHWRFPDFQGLYLTIFRYKCDLNGRISWYWEPDTHHIHLPPLPAPVPIPDYNTRHARFASHSLFSQEGNPFLISAPQPLVFGFEFAISKHFSMTASVCWT